MYFKWPLLFGEKLFEWEYYFNQIDSKSSHIWKIDGDYNDNVFAGMLDPM